MSDHVETFDESIILVLQGKTAENVERNREIVVDVCNRQVAFLLLTFGSDESGRRVAMRLVESVEWVFTNDILEAAEWVTHDCDKCRAAKDDTLKHMAQHPGLWMALGNIRYTNVYWGANT